MRHQREIENIEEYEVRKYNNKEYKKHQREKEDINQHELRKEKESKGRWRDKKK